MNWTLRVQGHIPPRNIENTNLSLSLIVNLLRLSQSDIALAYDFNQTFEIYQFQLGDQFRDYYASTSAENFVHTEQDDDWFYIVCQGRVRLLGYDATQKRNISVVVLEAGETFGIEALFCNIPELRCAIAASTGCVGRIRVTELQSWLQRLPQLRDYLQQQAIERQCLIFFKASTDLRGLTTHQLKQLSPYLEEIHISADRLLVEATPQESGRFWLRSGQIHSPQVTSSPPAVGESWGYPHPIPEDWLAQTDLVIYQLPVEHWEAAIGAGLITSADTDSQNGQQKSAGARVQHTVAVPSIIRQEPQLPTQSKNRGAILTRRATHLPSTTTQNSETESIVFPKPIRYRRRLGQGHPFIQQQSASDCGATCLATIGQYWGKRFNLNYLRNLAGVGRSGASLKGIATAAESLGFHARPVRASLNRLVEQKHPWIAHWQGDHYVVVYGLKGKRILIADPAVGKRSLSQQEFQNSWTGYALLLDPTEQLETVQTEKNSLGRFWGVLWPYRSLIGQIVLASLLIQVFGLITPLFTQIILDQVVVNKSFITLHAFAIGLLLFGIWRIGLTATRQYLLDYFANRVDLTLVSGFISHTLMLPLQFFASRHVGDIITRVQENQKIQLFLTRQAITAWLDASMAVVYLGLMAYYNWHLTLLVLALIPPIVILTLVASPSLRAVSRAVFNEEAGQNSALVEMINGIATVKAAAAERSLRWRWEDRLTSTLNARFQGQKLANGLQATGGLINTLGSTALLWYGANLVIQDQLTIGQFVAFNMLIGNVINPVLALVNLWDELQEVMVSVERLNDVFSADPEESAHKPLLVLPQLRGAVRFENVTFRYSQEQERNTLENISFEASAGQTFAIVGRSGSGKSTLVSLLQGLYHPTNGRICIDEHDIRHASPQSLRSQLGVVPQECFLFSGTILENITLYADEFTLEQVVEVAKLAEAHTFIQDLPLGYNTKVGERGANLSGGQRQRIAIARALLGNPQILILDEATSSLDTESERRFQQNLARISRDRTTFIIAHRLSTVRHADYILVLDKGILVERGTHDQLVALQGLYYHLAHQQLDL